jgi:hypothetical protein
MEGDRADKKKLNHASFSYNVYCCIFKTIKTPGLPHRGRRRLESNDRGNLING